jgi:hypothetical protein
MAATPWEALRFDNSYSRLPEVFFSRVRPTPARAPRWVAYNSELASSLGLEASPSERALRVWSGQETLAGFDPVAQVYAGHQFGHYVPRLGDGRAILLGELLAPDGRSWDLHLKGAGLTPYSRMGDGRAVLRSCVREYLAGEAMHGLGIPTTRALCVIASDEPVRRETIEPRAMLLRVAPGHVRFGTFQYFAHRGELPELACLFWHVLGRHEPDLLLGASHEEARSPGFREASGGGWQRPAPELVEIWLGRVVVRTARLLAAWQAVGFAHGVMNTDNFSVLGITLDYGPYGFLDDFEPGWICNHSDGEGRYAFDRQPAVGLWNCRRLVEALAPLLVDAEDAREPNGEVEARERAERVLALYEPEFHAEYARQMALKFGLADRVADGQETFPPRYSEKTVALMNGGLRLLAEGRVDTTHFFRSLAQTLRGDSTAFLALFAQPEAASAWLSEYLAYQAASESGAIGSGAGPAAIAQAMDAVNPRYVLRNHLAQRAIEAADAGDMALIERLARALSNPCVEQPGCADFEEAPPSWAKGVIVGCSS